jgi:hypothetical protein
MIITGFFGFFGFRDAARRCRFVPGAAMAGSFDP